MFDWLADVPLAAIGPGLFLAMLCAAAAGRALAKHPGPSDGEGTQEGYIVSAVFSLLAFLVGFTFSLAIDRYEARRLLVVDEANAIDTAYLRTQLLQEPHRSRIEKILIDYAGNRYRTTLAGRAEQRRFVIVNDRLLAELWSATKPAFETIRGTDFSSAYLDSINAVIELDAARKEARLVRVPYAVFALLLVYSIVAAAVLGHLLPERRGKLAAVALLALFTLAILLVLDINRPGSGVVRESQAPMERLLVSMHARQLP